jgi:hypothetical protein
VQKQYAAKAVTQNGIMRKWKEFLVNTQLNLMPMSGRLMLAAAGSKT